MRVIGRLEPTKLGALSKISSRDHIAALDDAGFDALDLWGADDFGICLEEFGEDPWERLRIIRGCLNKTKLQVVLRGQCLLGSKIYPDDITEYFIASLVDNGVDVIRAYDALNDSRNLETVIRAAKKFGAELQAGLVYTVSPAHSISFFAGYAALLEQMGADSICILDPERLMQPSDAAELISAIKRSVSIPIIISTSGAYAHDVSFVAEQAGVWAVERRVRADKTPGSAWIMDIIDECGDDAVLAETNEILSAEISHVRADAGYPPLAPPISDILKAQAETNIKAGSRYKILLPEFSALLRGMYGRTPAPVSESFAARTVGDDPMLLVRPASTLDPGLDRLCRESAQYLDNQEDILTYAIAEDEAVRFFEYRKALRYGLDAPHADSRLGVHVI
ncbi:MAG: hypothetical protein ACI3XO_10450 [Eubacteriales bacterium]